MRLNIRTKNNYSYYTIIKDYTNLNGKRTTTIFEKLGNQQQVEERFGKVNTIENIKKYIEELNNENKEEIINVQFNPNKTIEKNIKKDNEINELKEENNSLFEELHYFKNKFIRLIKFIKNRLFNKKDRDKYRDFSRDLYEHGVIEDDTIKELNETYKFSKKHDSIK